jgi:hypothetical protein
MLFWLIVLAVVVVLAALAWWTSGRKKPGGVDAEKFRQAREKSEGDAGLRSGRPPEGHNPGHGGPYSSGF